MTVKYRVKTKHTKELLKEFVKFSFRVNHPKTTLRLFVIGVGFLIIGTGMERGSLAMWMCLVIGILLCIFSFARHYIGVMQLKGNDEIYQNDWEVDTSFLDGEIRIRNSGETKGFSKSYKEVAALYMDENNYYIGIEGDNLYPLPRKCFVEGKQEEFENFIKKKTGQKMMYVPFRMKNKFAIIRENMKVKESEHDFISAMLEIAFVPFYQSGNGEDELNNHQNQHDKIAVQNINYHEEKIAYNP